MDIDCKVIAKRLAPLAVNRFNSAVAEGASEREAMEEVLSIILEEQEKRIIEVLRSRMH